MRQFVVLGHEVPLDASFSLDDLAGGAGRLDLLSRCVTAGLVLSHGLRENARVHLVLGDAFTVTADGASVRNLHPDERSTAALIRGALDEREEAIGHMAAEPSPGVEIRRFGFADALDWLGGDGTVIQLHEDGTPVVEREPPTDPIFVLSDHRDFTERETDLLADAADARLRLGPERIHADHAITVAHNYLDTDGFTRY